MDIQGAVFRFYDRENGEYVYKELEVMENDDFNLKKLTIGVLGFLHSKEESFPGERCKGIPLNEFYFVFKDQDYSKRILELSDQGKILYSISGDDLHRIPLDTYRQLFNHTRVIYQAPDSSFEIILLFDNPKILIKQFAFSIDQGVLSDSEGNVTETDSSSDDDGYDDDDEYSGDSDDGDDTSGDSDDGDDTSGDSDDGDTDDTDGTDNPYVGSDTSTVLSDVNSLSSDEDRKLKLQNRALKKVISKMGKFFHKILGRK